MVANPPTPVDPNPPIFVGIREAARLVGLSYPEMWRLVVAQTIASKVHGRRRLVVRADLERWAAALPERRAS